MYYVSWDSDECSHWTGWMNRLICVFIVCVDHIRINSNIEKKARTGWVEWKREWRTKWNSTNEAKEESVRGNNSNSSSNIEPTPTKGWFNGFVYMSMARIFFPFSLLIVIALIYLFIYWAQRWKSLLCLLLSFDSPDWCHCINIETSYVRPYFWPFSLLVNLLLINFEIVLKILA